MRIDRESLTNTETGESTNPYWQSTYSATGEFRLEGLYGVGQVESIAPGYVGVRMDIGLAQGEHEEGMLIALERGGEIRGFVFDAATREPIPKATVRLATPQDQPRADYMVKTRKDGSFIWTELLLDTPVTLVAGTQGYKHELLNVVATGRSEPEPVTVYLERGGTVRGRLFYNGGPPPGCDEASITDGYCMVSVRAPADQGYSRNFARPDGSYEVTGLEDGIYLVNASFRVNRTGAWGESISKWVTVRDGETTELDIDFDAPAGNIALEVSGLEAVNDVQMDLHAAGDSFVVSSFLLSSPKLKNGETYTYPIKVGGLPTLEPGAYVLRFYEPDDEDSVVEETVRVVAGQTVEVTFDLGGMEEDAEGQEAEVGAGDGATEEFVETDKD